MLSSEGAGMVMMENKGKPALVAIFTQDRGMSVVYMELKGRYCSQGWEPRRVPLGKLHGPLE
jgi:hypothetical protein